MQVIIWKPALAKDICQLIRDLSFVMKTNSKHFNIHVTIDSECTELSTIIQAWQRLMVKAFFHLLSDFRFRMRAHGSQFTSESSHFAESSHINWEQVFQNPISELSGNGS